MPNSLKAELLNMLVKEKKTNYCDASVFGGFAKAMADYGKELKSSPLQALAREYANSSLQARPDILGAMEALIRELEDPEGQPAPARRSENALQSPLATPVQYLKTVGPGRAKLFRKMGISDVEGLLMHFPRDYQDRRKITPIAHLSYAQQAIISGEVASLSLSRPRPKMVILKALIQDESGSIPAVWFNQSYLEKQLAKGRKITIMGRAERKYRSLEFMVQDFEFPEESGDSSFKGIIPIYRSTEALNQKTLRKIIALAWEGYSRHLKDVLPPEIIAKRGLLPRRKAMECLHFPPSLEAAEQGRKTLAYEEFFILQLAMAQNSFAHDEPGIAHSPLAEKWQAFEEALPFDLMEAQKRVIGEIYADMERPCIMARLLQGDVGAGKTIVAAAALYKAASGGHQGVLMAPTEILAQQHYQNLKPLFDTLGIASGLLTGSVKGKARQAVLGQLAEGGLKIIIGTHALIQEGVDIPDLGLAITDEQHRFGVLQRASLTSKGEAPDLLVMTATPIPRTLALTLYGDLNISVIDQLPPGRIPIKTYAVGNDLEERVFGFIAKALNGGKQAYIVCPLVEESEKVDLESAVELADKLAKEVFPACRVALLHGRMKAREKEEVMLKFRGGETDILVSTTVIEVGIDVPNASVMVIKDAQRFGLAQLHQLRGRIGRGKDQSYCILMHEAKSQVAKERMGVMTRTNDGFLIAEADLKLRGPGEFFGTRQHGIPELKSANLFKDSLLLEQAREDALEFLQKTEDWNAPQLALLKKHLQDKYQFLN